MNPYDGGLTKLVPVWSVTGEVRHVNKVEHVNHDNVMVTVARFGCYCGNTVEMRADEGYGETCSYCGMMYRSRQIIQAVGYESVVKADGYGATALVLYSQGRDLLMDLIKLQADAALSPTRERVDLRAAVVLRVMGFLKTVQSHLDHYQWPAREEAMMNAVKKFYINLVLTSKPDDLNEYASRYPMLADFENIPAGMYTTGPTDSTAIG